MLFAQMNTWVQFEDQDMIDSRRSEKMKTTFFISSPILDNNKYIFPACYIQLSKLAYLHP